MRSRRLVPLMHHADARRDEAAQAFAQRNAALAAQRQRLQDLDRFAAEYAPAAGVVDPAVLANRLALRARVEQAVGQQRKVIETCQANCEVERARLLLASRDRQVLEQLADSYRVREAREEDRRVQKEIDELAGRAARSFGDAGR